MLKREQQHLWMPELPFRHLAFRLVQLFHGSGCRLRCTVFLQALRITGPSTGRGCHTNCAQLAHSSSKDLTSKISEYGGIP